MGRMGCLLGVLLILVALAGLFLVVVLPVIPGIGNTPFLLNIQGALFCPAGHTYEQEQEQLRTRPGETFFMVNGFCITAEGERIPFSQEQETQRLIVSALIFTVPFLIGLLFATLSIGRMTRRAAGTLVGQMAGTKGGGTPQVMWQTSTRTMDMSDESLAEVKRLTGIDIQPAGDGFRVQMAGRDEPITVFEASSAAMRMPGAGGEEASLAERLKQLDEARDKGLISSEEYDRLRQAILDSLT